MYQDFKSYNLKSKRIYILNLYGFLSFQIHVLTSFDPNLRALPWLENSQMKTVEWSVAQICTGNCEM